MFITVCLIVFYVLSAAPLQGSEPRPVKTFGGSLLWGDVLFDSDWHIQQNIKTDSCRLLDSKSVQYAFGSFEECKERLEQMKIDEGVLPMSGCAVIILHGYASNASMLRKLADYLKENKTHDHIFCMSYPSTMQPILEHSKRLQQVVDNLPPTIRRIDFIGHSLGSIVIRRYLSGPLDENWQVPPNPLEYRKTFSPAGLLPSRIGQFVMIGPPNHGAELAKKMIGKAPLRRFLTGKSGDELGTDWDETEKSLGIPCCRFIVIAGGKGDDKGYSSLIPDDDDGIVSTEGTKLEGAAQWKCFPLKHGELLQNTEVFDVIKKILSLSGG
ncbi:MAG: alpha/beta hydrolase [Planctomycetaceae bacterium]|nr:alpha/beta hydrolase [Planctomycetaceae bacterium]